MIEDRPLMGNQIRQNVAKHLSLFHYRARNLLISFSVYAHNAFELPITEVCCAHVTDI